MVLGVIRLTPRMGTGLQRYGEAKLAGIAPVMAASEQRVFEQARAHTPVDTGHMQEHLLRTSEIVPVTTDYQVFWRAQEFLGQVNPRGQIIQEFYPASLIFGDRFRAAKYPTLLTEELEAERPTLIRNLTEHFRRLT
jgi:hypothetical protein